MKAVAASQAGGGGVLVGVGVGPVGVGVGVSVGGAGVEHTVLPSTVTPAGCELTGIGWPAEFAISSESRTSSSLP